MRIIICFITVFIILFLLGNVTFAKENERSHKNNSEMPLIDCDGIVVDSDGNIYLGNGLFGQVQVYSRHGEYIYSIKPNTSGSFNLNIDEKDNLYVAIVRSRIVKVFDKNGFVIKEIPDPNTSIYDSYNINKNAFTAKDGTVYKIIRFYGYVTVARSENGNNVRVYGMPIFHWLLKVVIMIIFMGGAVIANVIGWTYRLGKKNREIRKNRLTFKKYCLAVKLRRKNLNLLNNTPYMELHFWRNEIFHRIITIGMLLVLSTMYISYLSWVSYPNIAFDTFAGFIVIFVLYLILNKLILLIRYLCSRFAIISIDINGTEKKQKPLKYLIVHIVITVITSTVISALVFLMLSNMNIILRVGISISWLMVITFLCISIIRAMHTDNYSQTGKI